MQRNMTYYKEDDGIYRFIVGAFVPFLRVPLTLVSVSPEMNTTGLVATVTHRGPSGQVGRDTVSIDIKRVQQYWFPAELIDSIRVEVPSHVYCFNLKFVEAWVEVEGTSEFLIGTYNYAAYLVSEDTEEISKSWPCYPDYFRNKERKSRKR